MAENLLEVNNLKTYFFTRSGVVKAVDDVSFTIKPSETLGVVGESGCGKSVTALSVMRLIASPPGKIVGGEINFNGEDVLEKNHEELTELRGSKISMIFQDPMTRSIRCLPLVFKLPRRSSDIAKKLTMTRRGNARLKCWIWFVFQMPNDVQRTTHTSSVEV